MTDPLARIAALFDEADVEYALIGGHAVNTWIEPRFTADIDVTIEAGATAMERVKGILLREGLALEVEHGAELPSGPDFLRFASKDRTLRLEIQVAKTELQHEILRRARPAEGVRVATVEDLIILKLIADRAKDQADLDALSRLPGVDWSYVERWAQDWELTARLAELREAPDG